MALEDASTTKKGIVQLSSATNSTSESLAATPKAVKAACENAEKRLQKDKNGADVPDKDTFTKNIGACRAFGGAVSTTTGDWTTAQFIGWLESQGAFNHPYWMCKGSWSYGNNKIITDTGCGNIHLAGAVIEVMGIKSAMTIRITTPTTSSGSGTANAQFTYINHGDGYSPGWRRDYNTKNKPPAFALGKTGETLADTDAVAWNLDSGAYCAQDGGASSLILHFNTGEGSCPAVQFRVNYRNGGIFYRSARDGYGFEADWERLFTTTGGTLDGAVGIGAQNTLGGHSLALGRGDTGLKQNGDGNLDVYAGNARVMRFTNGSIQVSKGLNVSGRVNPSDYSNFDIRYVRDIRLGTRVVQGMQKGVTYEKSGHVITGLCLVGDA
ncbi:tail fiber protein, partial [Escherichia coli]|nr:tail fiber protein [Escherichia coli]